MGIKGNQKLKLLFILDILKKHSDDEHALSAETICDYLCEYGINAERKSIYNDIAILSDYGYDIVKVHGNNAGCFLADRGYELAELRLLCDAVQAADFIPVKKTKQLVDKILQQASIFQAEKIKNQVYVDSRRKCNNEEIYYTIDKLDNAINNKKMVNIVYRKRVVTDENRAVFEEKTHIISPYAMIWANDRYYLVCNNQKYNNLMVNRIDRIKHVDILDDTVSRPFSEVSPYQISFDSADYANKHFNMFSGDPKPVELICNDSLIENILDKFGDNANIKKYGSERFLLKADVAVSEGLIAWIMQFGGDIEIKSPVELKNMLFKKLNEIKSAYTI